ncbi:MAG: hypothetical protein COB98_08660 [Flavobacteriaceae bacterium]|nr:MAG: hypothetical protein COB98_08660 [Flavobacteriaceae bacterium]
MKFKALLLISILSLQCKENVKVSRQLPIKKVTDSLYGVKIIDPYRYLENIEDTIALNWYKFQTNLTNKLILKISNRDKIINLQKEINNSNSNKVSDLKITNNNKYFYLKEDKKDHIKKLFYRNGFNKKEALLFSPTEFSNNTVLNYINPNWDGSKIIIGITTNDTEIGKIIILDVNKREKDVKYPSVFLTAGINDSRVVLWQPTKFAAKLKDASISNNPILLSVNFKEGHGFDASRETKDKELVKLLSFAFWQTGHPDFQLKTL